MNSKKNDETTDIPIFFVNFVNRKTIAVVCDNNTIL